ncbi:hypothetical protein CLCR_03612 [Cladophialophora carrionii]|uniref:Uncharacterized protein n=1 Tax=Cladophialophora carrionii TaxID=86049 RepID=A0A1C1CGC9_9EURO|nr:hypothetical protein CLCR_03612 [Cladophialophora carrionii]
MAVNRVHFVETNNRPNTEAAELERPTKVITLEDAGIPVETELLKRYPPPHPRPHRREFAVSRSLLPRLPVLNAPSNITSAPMVENVNDGLNFGFFAPNDPFKGPYGDQYRNVCGTGGPDRVNRRPLAQGGSDEQLESTRFLGVTCPDVNWFDNPSATPSSYTTAARLHSTRNTYAEWQSTEPATEQYHSLYSEPHPAKVEYELPVPRLRSPLPWTEKDSRLERTMQDATGEMYQKLRDTLLDSAWGGKRGRMRYAKGAISASVLLTAAVSLGPEGAVQAGEGVNTDDFETNVDWGCGIACFCGAHGCPGTEAMRRAIGRKGAFTQQSIAKYDDSKAKT